MNYKIYPISEEYIQGFCAAVDSVARERKYLAFLEGPPIEMSRDFVRKNIRGKWPHFVALSEGAVIGWCDITSLDRPVYSHSGVLGMGVIKNYRGKGIGKELIQAALNQAKVKGLTRVELTVREQNRPAIALYEKFDFFKEGVKQKAVKIENDYENLICMAILFEQVTSK